MAYGLSCSMAWAIFPGQGSNPCALHWQTDPSSLSHHRVRVRVRIRISVRAGAKAMATVSVRLGLG